MKRQRKVRGAPLLVAIAAVIGLTACGPSATPDATTGAQKDEEVTVALLTFGTASALPWIGGGTAEMAVWSPVYDPIIGMSRDVVDTDFTYGLTESAELSEDGSTYTLKIRQGIPFHKDRGVLTAGDVAYTINRVIAPESTGQQSGTWRGVIESVEAPDDETVVVHVKPERGAVVPYLLRSQSIGVVSEDYVEEVGDEVAGREPIGTGPFEYTSSVEGSSYSFTALEEHWVNTPNFTDLKITRVPDLSTTLQALQTGEVDFAQLFGTYLEQARGAGLSVFSTDTVGNSVVNLPGMFYGTPSYTPDAPWVGDLENPNSESFERAVLVRKALATAIDKQAIIDTVLAGVGSTDAIPAPPWAPGLPAWDDAEWEVTPYDVDAARELLAEAGYPDGEGIPPIKLSLVPLQAFFPQVTQAVAQYWEAIGIEVELINQDGGAFRTEATAGTMEAGLYTSATGPSTLSTISSDLISTNRGVKFGFSFPKIDEMAGAILAEQDTDAQNERIRELLDYGTENELLIRLGWVGNSFVGSDKIEDYQLMPSQGQTGYYWNIKVK